MVKVPICRAAEISIHAPPRGATVVKVPICRAAEISIHAPPRGATLCVYDKSQNNKIFQFTPLREGRRQARRSASPRQTNFNSRPSARGDATVTISSCNSLTFQFTPLREGRRSCADCQFRKYQISIHAPPRGATHGWRGNSKKHKISIHAPPRGATTWGRGPSDSTSFQFTPLREGRRRFCWRLWRLWRHFNSRPSARGDLSRCPRVRASGKFQFTPLREGRHKQPPQGDDHDTFQFTPLREGRLQRRRVGTGILHFNSRPSARGDGKPQKTRKRHAHFNSRPSARGDGKRYAISANLLFNPYKSAWLNNSATQFVEIILVIFHRIIA